MSRCKACGNPFEEENGWQEYCSISCAMCDVIGRVVTANDQGQNSKAWQKWYEWFSNPKNKRLVRVSGEPAQKPKVGKWVKRQVVVSRHGEEKKVKVIDVNIGGSVVLRPITKEERESAERQRGRESFGANMIENHVCRQLPSKRGLAGLGWFPHDE